MAPPPQIKAIFPSKGLEMVAQVYSDPKLRCLVVELTRRAGDAFYFKQVREKLTEALGSTISSDADIKAIARR